MLIGLLILLGPVVVFAITLPFSRNLRPPLRKLYWIVGGLVVFCGGGTSVYFAAYSGDQGGIAAYFFQIAVLTVYILFTLSLLVLNGLSSRGDAHARPLTSRIFGLALGGLAPLVTGMIGLWNYITRGYFIAKSGELVDGPLAMIMSVLFILVGVGLIVYAIRLYQKQP